MLVFPVNSFCWSNSAEHDVTLTSFMTDPAWPPACFLSRCAKLLPGELRLWKFQNALYIGSFLRKTTGHLCPPSGREGYNNKKRIARKFDLCILSIISIAFILHNSQPFTMTLLGVNSEQSASFSRFFLPRIPPQNQGEAFVDFTIPGEQNFLSTL